MRNNSGAETVNRSKARILVVDDHPIVREGLAGLLNRQPDMLCCADVGNVADAWTAAESKSPDVAIIDLRLGNADGLELIKLLRARFPELRILALSQLDQATFAERALRAGAQGFVMKEEASDELLGAIRTVLKGEVYAPRGLALKLLRSMVGGGLEAVRTGVELLTDRELHILQLIGSGMSTRAISEQLKLSLKTVEAHRENIKHKLDLPNAAALIRYATVWSRQQISFPPGDGKVDR